MIKTFGLLALTAFNFVAIPNSNNDFKTIKQVNKTADNSFNFPNHNETAFGHIVNSSVEGKNYYFTFTISEDLPPTQPLPNMGDIEGIFYFDYYNQLTGHMERFAEKTKVQTLGFMEKIDTQYKLSTNLDQISMNLSTDNAWKAYNGDIIPLDSNYINSNLRNFGFYIDNSRNAGGYEYINILPTNTDIYDSVFNDIYDKGYDTGFELGHDKGSKEGYDKGFNEGQGVGYDKGYNKGYADGLSASDEGVANGVFGLLGNAFNSVAGILSIEVFENVSIGTLLLVPLTIAIIFTICKLLGV